MLTSKGDQLPDVKYFSAWSWHCFNDSGRGKIQGNPLQYHLMENITQRHKLRLQPSFGLKLNYEVRMQKYQDCQIPFYCARSIRNRLD